MPDPVPPYFPSPGIPPYHYAQMPMSQMAMSPGVPPYAYAPMAYQAMQAPGVPPYAPSPGIPPYHYAQMPMAQVPMSQMAMSPGVPPYAYAPMAYQAMQAPGVPPYAPSPGIPPYHYAQMAMSPGIPPYHYAQMPMAQVPMAQVPMAQMAMSPGVPPYAYAPMAYQAMQAPGVPPYAPSPGIPPYHYAGVSMQAAEVPAATDPTMSGNVGWSMWRFDGQKWELKADHSSPGARPVAPKPSDGKFLGQMARTPSTPIDRDDATPNTDVGSDPHEINEIVRRAMDIPGYGTEEELRWIAGTAASLDPGAVWVEIGSMCGRSFLATGLSLPSNSTLVTVDRWLGETSRRGLTIFETYKELIQSRPDLNVLLARADSPIAATFMQHHLCHVVFIDGDHQAEAVRSDIQAWSSKVIPGGMLCGHDYGIVHYPGLQQVVDELPGSAVAVGSIWVWHP